MAKKTPRRVRMSPVDTAWLRMDTPANLMMIVGVWLIEPTLSVAEARQRVLTLATLIGFDAVDAGPLLAARYLEPFAMTWIHLAFRQGLGRQFAFGLMRRG